MSKGVTIVLSGLAIVVVGGVGALAFTKNKGKLAEAFRPPEPAAVVVPADATVLADDVEPGHLIAEIAGVRRESDRRAVEQYYAGMWSPGRGWTGEVADVTKERSGVALRLFYAQGGSLNSGFYVIAVIPSNDEGIEPRDVVTVQGKITRLEGLATMPLPTYRVVLEPSRVLAVRKPGR